MPLVIQDDITLPTESSDSKRALENILRAYPEYEKEIDPNIYKIIDFNATTKTGIKCYQFNKIRIKLSIIQRKHGFPASRDYTVAFYGFVMFGIPWFTKIFLTPTINAWIGKRGIGDYGNLPFVDYDRPYLYNWRQVVIHDLPPELLDLGLGAISMIPGIYTIVTALMYNTARLFPIFENILSFGGLNNKVIISNWDKIYKKLIQNGY